MLARTSGLNHLKNTDFKPDWLITPRCKAQIAGKIIKELGKNLECKGGEAQVMKML